MKVGLVGTHLHLVCAEPGKSPETDFTTEICSRMAWEDLLSSPAKSDVAEYAVHSFQWWLDNRNTRVAMLRARVKSGTYKIDSMTIAESILSDKIHSG